MKTRLSPAQQQVMDLFATGLTGQQIADQLCITLTSVYRRRQQALYKRRVAVGASPMPVSTRTYEEDETPEEIRERIALDLAFDIRCPHCHVVLEGSDCAEAGTCVARSPDLLRGDSIDRIRDLWYAVQRGVNQRE